ncbi:MAG TPA: DUF6538 domain-containing protein [Steroidobacteraceae bacterium]|nr:DUF6538 domain-containing protein [Steroidobacteraceae bacterium]
MKATDDRNVFKRGKGGVYCVRRRIPKPLLTAYPRGKTEIVRSLGTADPRTSQALRASAVPPGRPGSAIDARESA